ncbi:peroxiredoxin family protein [Parasediminibacterium sp. JCM 36343]|uniref:peroxiredoxin family protein n=1 Tax=Parasediminibacterium sp. JCM 36343 TaxID=3374279 RepID=UPI00397E02A7
MKKTIIAFVAMLFSMVSMAQTGLKVGEKAPNFIAKNQNGKTVSLQNTLQKGKVVVLFYRGFWCPGCSKAVKSLQDSLQLLTDKNVSVIAISPEGADGVAKTVSKSKATFSVLSDEGLKISKAYKVIFKVTPDMDTIHKKYNIDVVGNNGKNGNYLPRPSAFIIEQDGKISYRYFNNSPYSNPNSNNRVTVKELLAHL